MLLSNRMIVIFGLSAAMVLKASTAAAQCPDAVPPGCNRVCEGVTSLRPHNANTGRQIPWNAVRMGDQVFMRTTMLLRADGDLADCCWLSGGEFSFSMPNGTLVPYPGLMPWVTLQPWFIDTQSFTVTMQICTIDPASGLAYFTCEYNYGRTPATPDQATPISHTPCGGTEYGGEGGGLIPHLVPVRPRNVGDVNYDDRVDLADLAAVLARWGLNNRVEDLNRSGRVDVDDLVQVLIHWSDPP